MDGSCDVSSCVVYVWVWLSYRELVLDLELLAGRAHQVLHQILHTHITQIDREGKYMPPQNIQVGRIGEASLRDAWTR